MKYNRRGFLRTGPLRLILLCCACFLLCATVGCEALARKFTRKSKKEQKEEMVLVPQEYLPLKQSKEEVYRQNFLFWKSWHDELINALFNKLSQKKQLDCLQEAMGNLEKLKPLLNAAKQQLLDKYLAQFKELQEKVQADPYNNQCDLNRYTAERLRRDILRDFSYPRVKKDLA